MKGLYRLVIATIAVIILSTGVFGYAYAQPTWELGVKSGLNFAKLRGDVKDSEQGTFDLGDGYYMTGRITQAFDESKLGFVGGVYAAVHITDRFGIRLEGLYTKKGGTGETSGSLDAFDPMDNYVGTVIMKGDNTVTLDYFEIPLLAVASFPISPNASFDLFAGPALAFNTNAEVEVEMTISILDQSQTETETIDMKDDTESIDYGGVIGAGVTFQVTPVVLFAEARMTYGFKNIDKYEIDDIKNSNFGIIVGVGLPLVKIK